ncbi:hypothetical protein ADL21_18345 [Streptomyces albus subsp. albus]|nr:hypothetical protein ADL21_18345 [Streptomyces albus subsp. albus]
MSNAFKTRTLDLTTGTKEAVADITDDCAAFLRDVANGADGLLNVFVPHATSCDLQLSRSPVDAPSGP